MRNLLNTSLLAYPFLFVLVCLFPIYNDRVIHRSR